MINTPISKTSVQGACEDAIDAKISNPTTVTKSITMSTGAGAQKYNLFSLVGAVKVLELKAECTEATNSTTLSNLHFDLYDGTLATAITMAVGGLDASSIGVGGVVFKGAGAAMSASYLDNATGTIIEATTPDVGYEFDAIKKLGADTYIRIGATEDGDTDVDFTVTVKYESLSSSGAITAV